MSGQNGSGVGVRPIGRLVFAADRSVGREPMSSAVNTELVASPSSREKILEVAEAHFARRGFSGVGLREVAVAAGLGKSSLFHHFDSKAQLYFEVLERVLGRIQERLEPALGRPASPSERLDGWVDALVDALAEHPTTARLLLRGLVEEEDFPDEPLLEAQRAEQLL